MTPDVSVVVPVRDGAATLGAAVRSALGQRTRLELEVVIAVGPSTDRTLEVATGLREADPRVTVVANPSGTTPAALNAAIAASRGPVVVRLDAHAVLPTDYVQVAFDTLHRTGAGNVGGRQVPVGASGVQAAVAAAMRSPVGAGGAAYRTGRRAGPVDTVYLGVFRRDALEQVGGFDEDLLRNQDYELNVRLRAAGWEVWFEPGLEVAYAPRASLRSLARQYAQYGQWKRVVLRRHPTSVRLRQLASPLLVVALTVLAGVGPLAGWTPLLGLVAAYLAVVCGGALLVDLRRWPLVAAALITMHLAWGVGFLLGWGSSRPS